jgi:hypothetical protein
VVVVVVVVLVVVVMVVVVVVAVVVVVSPVRSALVEALRLRWPRGRACRCAAGVDADACRYRLLCLLMLVGCSRRCLCCLGCIYRWRTAE